MQEREVTKKIKKNKERKFMQYLESVSKESYNLQQEIALVEIEDQFEILSEGFFALRCSSFSFLCRSPYQGNLFVPA